MDRMHAGAARVESVIVADRPVWQKPGMIEIAISDVTECCTLVPSGSDSSPYVVTPS